MKQKFRRLTKWAEEKADAFEQSLDSKGYSEEQKNRVFWSYRYVLDKTGFLLVFLIMFSFLRGADGVWGTIPLFAVLMVLGVYTKGRSDTYLLAGLLFILAVFSANLFFDDLRKTIAFPLAYLFYRAGKHICPDFVQRFLDGAERGILGRSRIESPNDDVRQYVDTAAEKNSPVKDRPVAATQIRSKHPKRTRNNNPPRFLRIRRHDKKSIIRD